MRFLFRSAALRAATIFVYCYGAILAPTIHHASHHDDHIHVGDTIIYVGEGHTDHDHPQRHDLPGNDVDDDDHGGSEAATVSDSASDDPDDDAGPEPSSPHHLLHHAGDDGSEQARLDHSHHDDLPGNDEDEDQLRTPRHDEDSDPATIAELHHHHSHHHEHHNDTEHGSNSIWHFGASLGDHLDRTPVLTPATEVARLSPDFSTPVPPTTIQHVLRLRGPPPSST